jgi:hypothetical protein
MSRLAIGYSPNPDELDRPTAVFIEASDGVWAYTRGEPGPRVLVEPLTIHDGGAGEQARPGERRYFDGVLDSFSSSCLIRTVTEFEPTIFSSLLTVDEIWDALPRPHAPAGATAVA